MRTGGDIFRHSLNISVANICRFLVCIVTDLSCANNFLEDDDLSPYNRREHLSCWRLIVLFIIRLWNIKIRGQQLSCELKNEFSNFFFLRKLI